jgi:hypothetical protein
LVLNAGKSTLINIYRFQFFGIVFKPTLKKYLIRRMKKYYLHNGSEQQGPFDIENLKSKNITKDTPIWFEGLSEWTTAGKIAELSVLFANATPPPFNASSSTPPPPKEPAGNHTSGKTKPASDKDNKLGVILQSIGAVGALIIIGMVIYGSLNKSGSGSASTDSKSYQEKVMTVEEIERAQPAKFLSASGTFNENFWGNKMKVRGIIKNNATVASYKDAVVKVIFYSKTKTEIGSEQYTIYENFPPHSEVNFEVKVDNFKELNSIGVDVISAIPN